MNVNDPLGKQVLEAVGHELLGNVIRLNREVSDARSSVLADLKNLTRQQRDEFNALHDQIKSQSESKLWKMLYVVLPVGLGVLIWWLQLGTNQNIDNTSKKLTTRLALTEEFYKKKLSVYENADTLDRDVAGPPARQPAKRSGSMA